MLNPFRIALTISSTSWLIIIFLFKESCTIWATVLLLLIFAFTYCLLKYSKHLDHDTINKCVTCDLADSEFLPAYLGYFFVSLSINDSCVLLFIYSLIALFVYKTQAECFNPILLLLDYHFYRVTIDDGVKVFIIVKGRVIKNVHDIQFNDLRRINDVSFITKEMLS